MSQTITDPKPAPALTDQQRAAIRQRKVSVALAAGAGCGKTTVLIERFLSHLDPEAKDGDAARLNQLVAITFTERAAREMRERIRKTCRERLANAPDNQSSDWRELLRDLDSARISTIHAFCGALLRSHAVEAGLDPRFRVLEETQSETLLYELIEQELRRRLTDADEAMLELSVRFNFDRLRDMIAELLGRRHEIDWALWSGQTPEAVVALWEAFWRDTCLPLRLQRLADSPEAKTLREIAAQAPSAHPVMRERFAAICEYLPQLPGSADFAPVMEKLREAAKVQGGGSKKDWTDEATFGDFRDTAAEFRKKLDGAKKQLAFDPAAARASAARGLDLLRMTEGVAAAYEREKRELAVLDFDDLLIHAKNLLTGPQSEPLRKQWAGNLRLLLVDEFQDTDPLQVELVRALCNHEIARGKLFFVGDFNQSIYRFRGAVPQEFERLQNAVPEQGRLLLTENFRSQPAILEFVNFLFSETLREYQPLEPKRSQTTSRPAVEFVWATADIPHSTASPHPSPLPEGEGNDTADDAPAAERRRRREAERIARRIRAMLDNKEEIVVDRASEKACQPRSRPVQPGDIALLFRALTNVQYYEEALRRWGIDYYLVGGHAFYAQQEIYDLLNLLQAVEDPGDALSLTGALRSPFFNLWDETIFWLARHPDGLAIGLFADVPPEVIPEQAERVRAAAATLHDLRAMKDRLPIAGLIQRALDRTAYDALLLVEFLGERKLANLKKLIDQARRFDQSGIFSLADFIVQLKDFVVRQPKEPLAATQSETTSVVRLMTVHQAKGLEFPVVFVPNLDRGQRGPQKSAAFSPRLGPLVPGEDVVDGFKLHMQIERDEEEAEELRLLYVAMTRAADYLVLSAGVDDLDKPAGPWLRLLADQYDFADNNQPRGAAPPVKTSPEGATSAAIPAEIKSRRPLEKLLADAGQSAAEGKIHLPDTLAPIPPDASARRQFSFSRLSGELHRQAAAVPEITLSEDGEPPSLDPRGLGSLIHAVLAEVDFSQPGDWEEVLVRHAELHATERELDLAEPREMLARFFDSPRARQIARAGQVHRELEFLLTWPPQSGKVESRESKVEKKNSTFDQDFTPSKYLQGYLDCLYQDAGGAWHIVDFKTNRVTPETLPAVAAQYEMQMLLYALAVETLLGEPPREVVLHFLRTGEEYTFPWNEDAKRRIVGQVSNLSIF